MTFVELKFFFHATLKFLLDKIFFVTLVKLNMTSLILKFFYYLTYKLIIVCIVIYFSFIVFNQIISILKSNISLLSVFLVLDLLLALVLVPNLVYYDLSSLFNLIFDLSRFRALFFFNKTKLNINQSFFLLHSFFLSLF